MLQLAAIPRRPSFFAVMFFVQFKLVVHSCFIVRQITRVLIGDTTIDRTIQEQVMLAETGGTNEAILEGGVSSPRSGMEGGYDYGFSGGLGAGGVSSGLMQPEAQTPPQGVRQRGFSRRQQSEFTKAILLD